MKKVYHLLSVALLGAMALTSCEEDKIVNENNGEGNETDKNLTDYSFIASIKQSAPLGRSNLQNGVYTWNKGDAVTLWNRNFGAGYDFSITPGYNDNQPDKSAEFTGKAAVENLMTWLPFLCRRHLLRLEKQQNWQPLPIWLPPGM